MKIHQWILLYGLLGCLSFSGALADSVLPESGNCMDKRFKLPITGEVDFARTVKVLREAAPVFRKAGDNMPGRTVLPINTNLLLLHAGPGKLQVRQLGEDKPLGWMRRQDLLCANIPLREDSSPELVAYIKTATALRGKKPAAVKVYLRPEGKVCGKGGCTELSRFTGYYVFDRQNNRYLLAGEYKVDDTVNLLGWLEKDKAFIANSGYGVRPREELRYKAGDKLLNGKIVSPGSGLIGEEKPVCAYLSVEDAQKKRDCRPVLGGDRWYEIGLRIPVLKRIEKRDAPKLYRVVMPLPGKGVCKTKEGDLALCPEFLARPADTEAFGQLNRIDVLFLIDGTHSMRKYLAPVKESVNKIIDKMKDDAKFKAVQFRFGFRIYRDAYAGEREFEVSPLPDSCESDPRQNLKSFARDLKRITTTKEDQTKSDDYEENLFGGIEKVIDDVWDSCEERVKVLFVIGDHGYSAEAQQARGRQAVAPGFLVDGMRGNKAKGQKQVIVFALQAPMDSSVSNSMNSVRYDAYQAFTRQMTQLITDKHIKSNIRHGPKTQQKVRDAFIFSTNDSKLSDKIVSTLAKYVQPALVKDIAERIKAGAPLIKLIEKYQGRKEFGNVPGLFWDLVVEGACRDLGKQCVDKRVLDTTFEGFMPVSKELSVDLWFSAASLRKYRLLLAEVVSNIDQVTKSEEMRKTFVHALQKSLENVIKKPRYSEVCPRQQGNAPKKCSLKNYLKRYGHLPVRQDSPLFRYTLDELMDKNKVPECELQRLVRWIRNSYEILSIVETNRRPKFKRRKQPPGCPSGNDIPYIQPNSLNPVLFKKASMKYGQVQGGVKLYWVPSEYLP
ncbi:MAG: VWA domain-containing protein [Gammaproteobacteria bacterium]|nr:VWA domain-containing protein [Gammaproteobacteria bacterium]